MINGKLNNYTIQRLAICAMILFCYASPIAIFPLAIADTGTSLANTLPNLAGDQVMTTATRPFTPHGFVLAPVSRLFDYHRARPIAASFQPDIPPAEAGETAATAPKRDGAVLNEADAARYSEMFQLIQQDRVAEAVQLSEQVQNKILLGYGRAAFLLQKDTKADFASLRDWLQHYSDYPQADQLYSLAQNRRPRGAKLPVSPVNVVTMRGNLDATNRSLEARILVRDTMSSTTQDAVRTINGLLRQSRIEDALAALQSQQNNPDFPAQAMAEGMGAIAALRHFSEDPQPLRDLSAAHAARSPLATWITGIRAWREGRFGEAGQHFGQFVKNTDSLSPADLAAGYYWLGRAQYKQGNKTAASAAWRRAAMFSRCFYGQLARARLGLKADYVWDMPALDAKNRALIAAHPAGKRALALLQIKQPDLAAAELRQISLRGRPDLAMAVVATAHEHNLPALALQLGSFLRNRDGKPLDSALYPLPPWQAANDNHQAAAPDRAPDLALIYAVMRQESRFDPLAVSPAGARGLMQLMPQTARELDATTDKERLADPLHNISLGSRYLMQLGEQSDITHNVLLILAAYNGGPGNLLRWRLASSAGADPLLFIETMPVRETRHYVQSVLSNYWVYQSRLGSKPTTLQQLANGQWPKLPETMKTSTRNAQARPASPGVQYASR